MNEIRSLSQVARELGVDRRTVADLIRVNALATLPHPSNGRAVGVPLATFRELARRLKQRPVSTLADVNGSRL